MFITSDIYTVQSTALKLLNCWTDKVTKFDSSSFYNWEQDNMPVYDLEERTYYLWEKLGFPTSSIPGVSLVVSGDAPAASIGCNRNIFRSVSAAVNALPETINFPIIIEVANFGQMGDLVLNNLRFGPRGSLEIINRNFARPQAYASGTIGGFALEQRLNNLLSDSSTGNIYSYASAISLNTDIGTLLGTVPSLGGLFDASSCFKDSSCLSISSPVFSSTTDNRLANNCNGFVAIPTTTRGNGSFSNSLLNKGSLILASKNSLFGGVADTGILFKTYDLNSDATDAVTTRDASTIDLAKDGVSHLYLNNYSVQYAANGLLYGNILNKVVINNCEGPIYLRNFFLDGSGANLTNNFNGVEVANCNNVYLENIVATRYRNAGFIFNNSNVTLLRGCVASRIYGFNSANERLTGNWSSKKLYDSFNSTYDYTEIDSAAGLISNNSIITVSSTRSFEDPLNKARVSQKTTGIVSDWNSYTNVNYIFDFSKNANGIVLNNSTFKGGDTHNLGDIDHHKYTININCYGNIECGIKANNSKISFDGRFNVYENLFGVKLDSSVFEIDKLSLIYNQKTALDAVNSKITYNKNLAPYISTGSNDESYSPLFFSGNGQHLVINNSTLTPTMASGMDNLYDSTEFINSIGIKNPSETNKDIIPGIEVLNNSKCVLVGPYLTRDTDHSVKSGSNYSVKGSEISVRNNSKANLIGTKNKATRVIGPANRILHKNLAGTYAGDNSTIEFNGPTLIAQYGIDILGENNSVINIMPQRANDESTLDISSFSLSDKLNHTAVELHSTRACVVVDKHSTFNVKDLGSFAYNWDVTGSYYSNREASGIDYGSLSAIEPYVSAGSLQFYPNPIPPESYPNYDNNNFVGAPSATFAYEKFSLASDNRSLYYLKNRNTAYFDYSSITNGGYCVRALNGSLVNVNNVNFPCGWWNCSAPYYDNSVAISLGGLCYKTFIWNIADNSQVKASYVSVSGLYPIAAGYVGPSGVWGSGTGAIASGLPSSTPDTSTVSILDYFGAAPVAANPFGKTSAQNYGPFRLYFSIDPAVQILTDLNSTTYHVIPQIYSQGYQPSSYLKGVDYSASTLYPGILQRNSSNVIQASGYYYGNTMTDRDGYTRVLLDESAANTFANAKHCAVGKSNNSKLVSIHYPYTDIQVGSSYTQTGVKSPNTFDLQRDN